MSFVLPKVFTRCYAIEPANFLKTIKTGIEDKTPISKLFHPTRVMVETALTRSTSYYAKLGALLSLEGVTVDSSFWSNLEGEKRVLSHFGHKMGPDGSFWMRFFAKAYKQYCLTDILCVGPLKRKSLLASCKSPLEPFANRLLKDLNEETLLFSCGSVVDVKGV